jgi:transposase
MYHAFGVREGYKYRRTEYVEGRVEFHLEARLDKLRCPDCKGDALWQRGSRERRIKTLPIGGREVVLVTQVPRCECANCGKRFEFAPPLPKHSSILPESLPSSSAI